LIFKCLIIYLILNILMFVHNIKRINAVKRLYQCINISNEYDKYDKYSITIMINNISE